MTDIPKEGTSTDDVNSPEKDPMKKWKTYENRKHQNEGLPSPITRPSGDSPISRYGRQRKPKIIEDYCDIDEIFPKTKTTPSPTTKKKLDITPVKSNETVNLPDLDVTVSDADLLKISSDTTEVSRVLKLVSSQSPTAFITDFPSTHLLKPIKTYTNRRKRSRSFDEVDLMKYPEELEGTFESDPEIEVDQGEDEERQPRKRKRGRKSLKSTKTEVQTELKELPETTIKETKRRGRSPKKKATEDAQEETKGRKKTLSEEKRAKKSVSPKKRVQKRIEFHVTGDSVLEAARMMSESQNIVSTYATSQSTIGTREIRNETTPLKTKMTCTDDPESGHNGSHHKSPLKLESIDSPRKIESPRRTESPKRGRPPKNPTQTPASPHNTTKSQNILPPLNIPTPQNIVPLQDSTEKPKRGRKPKKPLPEPPFEPPESSTEEPLKTPRRGRPSKKKTHIKSDITSLERQTDTTNSISPPQTNEDNLLPQLLPEKRGRGRSPRKKIEPSETFSDVVDPAEDPVNIGKKTEPHFPTRTVDDPTKITTGAMTELIVTSTVTTETSPGATPEKPKRGRKPKKRRDPPTEDTNKETSETYEGIDEIFPVAKDSPSQKTPEPRKRGRKPWKNLQKTPEIESTTGIPYVKDKTEIVSGIKDSPKAGRNILEVVVPVRSVSTPKGLSGETSESTNEDTPQRTPKKRGRKPKKVAAEVLQAIKSSEENEDILQVTIEDVPKICLIEASKLSEENSERPRRGRSTKQAAQSEEDKLNIKLENTLDDIPEVLSKEASESIGRRSKRLNVLNVSCKEDDREDGLKTDGIVAKKIGLEGSKIKLEMKQDDLEEKKIESEVKKDELEGKKTKSEVKKDRLEGKKVELEMKKGELEGKKVESEVKKDGLEMKKIESEVKETVSELLEVFQTKKDELESVSEVKKRESEIKERVSQPETGPTEVSDVSKIKKHGVESESQTKKDLTEVKKATAQPNKESEVKRKGTELNKLELEVTKTQSEVKKTELEMKKVESEAKKSGVEVKKTESEVKKSGIELKIDSEVKKSGLEVKKISSESSVTQSETENIKRREPYTERKLTKEIKEILQSFDDDESEEDIVKQSEEEAARRKDMAVSNERMRTDNKAKDISERSEPSDEDKTKIPEDKSDVFDKDSLRINVTNKDSLELNDEDSSEVVKYLSAIVKHAIEKDSYAIVKNEAGNSTDESTSPVKRRRGRISKKDLLEKTIEPEVEDKTVRRGRPPKKAVGDDKKSEQTLGICKDVTSASTTSFVAVSSLPMNITPKRGRGRPPSKHSSNTPHLKETVAKKKDNRGRKPWKHLSEDTITEPEKDTADLKIDETLKTSDTPKFSAEQTSDSDQSKTKKKKKRRTYTEIMQEENKQLMLEISNPLNTAEEPELINVDNTKRNRSPRKKKEFEETESVSTIRRARSPRKKIEHDENEASKHDENDDLTSRNEDKTKKEESEVQNIDKKSRTKENEDSREEMKASNEELKAKIEESEVRNEESKVRNEENKVRRGSDAGREESEVRRHISQDRSEENEPRKEDSEVRMHISKVRSEETDGSVENKIRRDKSEVRIEESEVVREKSEVRRLTSTVRSEETDRSEDSKIISEKCEVRREESEVRRRNSKVRSEETDGNVESKVRKEENEVIIEESEESVSISEESEVKIAKNEDTFMKMSRKLKNSSEDLLATKPKRGRSPKKKLSIDPDHKPHGIDEMFDIIQEAIEKVEKEQSKPEMTDVNKDRETIGNKSSEKEVDKTVEESPKKISEEEKRTIVQFLVRSPKATMPSTSITGFGNSQLDSIFNKEDVIKTDIIKGRNSVGETEQIAKTGKIIILKNEVIKKADVLPTIPVEDDEEDQEITEITSKTPHVFTPPTIPSTSKTDDIKSDLIDSDSDSSIESPMYEKHVAVESPIFIRESKRSLAQKIVDFKLDPAKINLSMFAGKVDASPITEKELKMEIQKIIIERQTKVDPTKSGDPKKMVDTETQYDIEEDIVSSSTKEREKSSSPDEYDHLPEYTPVKKISDKIDTTTHSDKKRRIRQPKPVLSPSKRSTRIINKRLATTLYDPTSFAPRMPLESPEPSKLVSTPSKSTLESPKRSKTPLKTSAVSKALQKVLMKSPDGSKPISKLPKVLKTSPKPPESVSLNLLQTSTTETEIPATSNLNKSLGATPDTSTVFNESVSSKSPKKKSPEKSKSSEKPKLKSKTPVKLEALKFVENLESPEKSWIPPQSPKSKSSQKVTPKSQEKSRSPKALKSLLPGVTKSRDGVNLSLKPVEEVKIVKRPVGRPKSSLGAIKVLSEGESLVGTVESVDVPAEILPEDDIKVGMLFWAKIGFFPYWPCIIDYEPGTNLVRKIKKAPGKNNVACVYHVIFFGDNGKRAWVSRSYLFPFKSRNDLSERYIQVKKTSKGKSKVRINHPNHSSSFLVPKGQQFKWNTAVNEAESILMCEEEKRVETFKEMLLDNATELVRRRRSKDEDIHINTEEEEKTMIVEDVDKGEVEKSKKRKRVTETDESGNVDKKYKVDEVVTDKVDVMDDVPLTVRKIPDEAVDKTPMPSMEPQTTESDLIVKRVSLFKGVHKVRVCQICFKPDKVFRCKGLCGGLFHVGCERKQNNSRLSPHDFEESSNSTVDTDDFKVKDYSSDSNSSRGSNNKIVRKNSVSCPLSIAEQIDLKMQEVMKGLIDTTKYADSATESDSDIQEVADENKMVSKNVPDSKVPMHYKCTNCQLGIIPPCFICERNVSKIGNENRMKCSSMHCMRYYHRECLKDWPQTKWSYNNNTELLTCPCHVCHTCISDDPRAPSSRLSNEKLTKCIRCPTTYHPSEYCVPAGSEIFSNRQIICPKHYQKHNKTSKWKSVAHINASWCFICSMGGSLICCETCPASFHAECLKINLPEGGYICEECESGRLPLYNEVVWVKLGLYRWWPAKILYPTEIPKNILNIKHNMGEFAVKFFGTYNYYWVNRGRVFLFQEGDSGYVGNRKNSVDTVFLTAIEEANNAHKWIQKERDNQTEEWKIGMKPPTYIKIKANRPVGNVRIIDADTSNTTPCDCDPRSKEPCGPDSDCLNRILLTECDPLVCAAGDRCCNQQFEKRNYAPVVPFRTSARGWGLKCLAPIKKGSFVIEYVGEIIDEQEYQKRIRRKHEQKDENYYFLTIDKDRMIDAGPKGNVARFMNHSCSPNCETQKWTVNGDTRVGLFAICDIPADTELTFNYNLECIGEEKKICKCGAENCSGFIGVKVKQEEKKKSKMKKKSSMPVIESVQCFKCGEMDAEQICANKICSKHYHLKCVDLPEPSDKPWYCSRHNCNVCHKRTQRFCYLCTNSYCPAHSKGNIRYDETKFVCKKHDKIKKSKRYKKSSISSGGENIEERFMVSGGIGKNVDEGRSIKTDIEINNSVVINVDKNVETKKKKGRPRKTIETKEVNVQTDRIESPQKRNRKSESKKRYRKTDLESNERDLVEAAMLRSDADETTQLQIVGSESTKPLTDLDFNSTDSSDIEPITKKPKISTRQSLRLKSPEPISIVQPLRIDHLQQPDKFSSDSELDNNIRVVKAKKLSLKKRSSTDDSENSDNFELLGFGYTTKLSDEKTGDTSDKDTNIEIVSYMRKDDEIGSEPDVSSDVETKLSDVETKISGVKQKLSDITRKSTCIESKSEEKRSEPIRKPTITTPPITDVTKTETLTNPETIIKPVVTNVPVRRSRGRPRKHAVEIETSGIETDSSGIEDILFSKKKRLSKIDKPLGTHIAPQKSTEPFKPIKTSLPKNKPDTKTSDSPRKPKKSPKTTFIGHITADSDETDLRKLLDQSTASNQTSNTIIPTTDKPDVASTEPTKKRKSKRFVLKLKPVRTDETSDSELISTFMDTISTDTSYTETPESNTKETETTTDVITKTSDTDTQSDEVEAKSYQKSRSSGTDSNSDKPRSDTDLNADTNQKPFAKEELEEKPSRKGRRSSKKQKRSSMETKEPLDVNHPHLDTKDAVVKTHDPNTKPSDMSTLTSGRRKTSDQENTPDIETKPGDIIVKTYNSEAKQSNTSTQSGRRNTSDRETSDMETKPPGVVKTFDSDPKPSGTSIQSERRKTSDQKNTDVETKSSDMDIKTYDSYPKSSGMPIQFGRKHTSDHKTSGIETKPFDMEIKTYDNEKHSDTPLQFGRGKTSNPEKTSDMETKSSEMETKTPNVDTHDVETKTDVESEMSDTVTFGWDVGKKKKKTRIRKTSPTSHKPFKRSQKSVVDTTKPGVQAKTAAEGVINVITSYTKEETSCMDVETSDMDPNTSIFQSIDTKDKIENLQTRTIENEIRVQTSGVGTSRKGRMPGMDVERSRKKKKISVRGRRSYRRINIFDKEVGTANTDAGTSDMETDATVMDKNKLDKKKPKSHMETNTTLMETGTSIVTTQTYMEKESLETKTPVKEMTSPLMDTKTSFMETPVTNLETSVLGASEMETTYLDKNTPSMEATSDLEETVLHVGKTSDMEAPTGMDMIVKDLDINVCSSPGMDKQTSIVTTKRTRVSVTDLKPSNQGVETFGRRKTSKEVKTADGETKIFGVKPDDVQKDAEMFGRRNTSKTEKTGGEAETSGVKTKLSDDTPIESRVEMFGRKNTSGSVEIKTKLSDEKPSIDIDTSGRRYTSKEKKTFGIEAKSDGKTSLSDESREVQTFGRGSTSKTEKTDAEAETSGVKSFGENQSTVDVSGRRNKSKEKKMFDVEMKSEVKTRISDDKSSNREIKAVGRRNTSKVEKTAAESETSRKPSGVETKLISVEVRGCRTPEVLKQNVSVESTRIDKDDNVDLNMCDVEASGAEVTMSKQVHSGVNVSLKNRRSKTTTPKVKGRKAKSETRSDPEYKMERDEPEMRSFSEESEPKSFESRSRPGKTERKPKGKTDQSRSKSTESRSKRPKSASSDESVEFEPKILRKSPRKVLDSRTDTGKVEKKKKKKGKSGRKKRRIDTKPDEATLSIFMKKDTSYIYDDLNEIMGGSLGLMNRGEDPSKEGDGKEEEKDDDGDEDKEDDIEDDKDDDRGDNGGDDRDDDMDGDTGRGESRGADAYEDEYDVDKDQGKDDGAVGEDVFEAERGSEGEDKEVEGESCDDQECFRDYRPKRPELKTVLGGNETSKSAKGVGRGRRGRRGGSGEKRSGRVTRGSVLKMESLFKTEPILKMDSLSEGADVSSQDEESYVPQKTKKRHTRSQMSQRFDKTSSPTETSLERSSGLETDKNQPVLPKTKKKRGRKSKIELERQRIQAEHIQQLLISENQKPPEQTISKNLLEPESLKKQPTSKLTSNKTTHQTSSEHHLISSEHLEHSQIPTEHPLTPSKLTERSYIPAELLEHSPIPSEHLEHSQVATKRLEHSPIATKLPEHHPIVSKDQTDRQTLTHSQTSLEDLKQTGLERPHIASEHPEQLLTNPEGEQHPQTLIHSQISPEDLKQTALERPPITSVDLEHSQTPSELLERPLIASEKSQIQLIPSEPLEHSLIAPKDLEHLQISEDLEHTLVEHHHIEFKDNQTSSETKENTLTSSESLEHHLIPSERLEPSLITSKDPEHTQITSEHLEHITLEPLGIVSEDLEPSEIIPKNLEPSGIGSEDLESSLTFVELLEHPKIADTLPIPLKRLEHIPVALDEQESHQIPSERPEHDKTTSELHLEHKQISSECLQSPQRQTESLEILEIVPEYLEKSQISSEHYNVETNVGTELTVGDQVASEHQTDDNLVQSEGLVCSRVSSELLEDSESEMLKIPGVELTSKVCESDLSDVRPMAEIQPSEVETKEKIESEIREVQTVEHIEVSSCQERLDIQPSSDILEGQMSDCLESRQITEIPETSDQITSENHEYQLLSKDSDLLSSENPGLVSSENSDHKLHSANFEPRLLSERSDDVKSTNENQLVGECSDEEITPGDSDLQRSDQISAEISDQQPTLGYSDEVISEHSDQQPSVEFIDRPATSENVDNVISEGSDQQPILGFIDQCSTSENVEHLSSDASDQILTSENVYISESSDPQKTSENIHLTSENSNQPLTSECLNQKSEGSDQQLLETVTLENSEEQPTLENSDEQPTLENSDQLTSDLIQLPLENPNDQALSIVPENIFELPASDPSEPVEYLISDDSMTENFGYRVAFGHCEYLVQLGASNEPIDFGNCRFTRPNEPDPDCEYLVQAENPEDGEMVEEDCQYVVQSGEETIDSCEYVVRSGHVENPQEPDVTQKNLNNPKPKGNSKSRHRNVQSKSRYRKEVSDTRSGKRKKLSEPKTNRKEASRTKSEYRKTVSESKLGNRSKTVSETSRKISKTPKKVSETTKKVSETPKKVSETPKKVSEAPKKASEGFREVSKGFSEVSEGFKQVSRGSKEDVGNRRERSERKFKTEGTHSLVSLEDRNKTSTGEEYCLTLNTQVQIVSEGVEDRNMKRKRIVTKSDEESDESKTVTTSVSAEKKRFKTDVVDRKRKESTNLKKTHRTDVKPLGSEQDSYGSETAFAKPGLSKLKEVESLKLANVSKPKVAYVKLSKTDDITGQACVKPSSAIETPENVGETIKRTTRNSSPAGVKTPDVKTIACDVTKKTRSPANVQTRSPANIQIKTISPTNVNRESPLTIEPKKRTASPKDLKKRITSSDIKKIGSPTVDFIRSTSETKRMASSTEIKIGTESQLKKRTTTPIALPSNDPKPMPRSSDESKSMPQSSNDPKPMPRSSNDPKSTLRSSNDPKATLRSSNDPKATLRSSKDPKSTLRSLTDPKSTPRSLNDPKTMHRSSDDPKSVLRSSNDPMSIQLSVESTREASDIVKATRQTSNTAKATRQTSNTAKATRETSNTAKSTRETSNTVKSNREISKVRSMAEEVSGSIVEPSEMCPIVKTPKDDASEKRTLESTKEGSIALTESPPNVQASSKPISIEKQSETDVESCKDTVDVLRSSGTNVEDLRSYGTSAKGVEATSEVAEPSKSSTVSAKSLISSTKDLTSSEKGLRSSSKGLKSSKKVSHVGKASNVLELSEDAEEAGSCESLKVVNTVETVSSEIVRIDSRSVSNRRSGRLRDENIDYSDTPKRKRSAKNSKSTTTVAELHESKIVLESMDTTREGDDKHVENDPGCNIGRENDGTRKESGSIGREIDDTKKEAINSGIGNESGIGSCIEKVTSGSGYTSDSIGNISSDIGRISSSIGSLTSGIGSVTSSIGKEFDIEQESVTTEEESKIVKEFVVKKQDLTNVNIKQSEIQDKPVSAKKSTNTPRFETETKRKRMGKSEGDVQSVPKFISGASSHTTDNDKKLNVKTKAELKQIVSTSEPSRDGKRKRKDLDVTKEGVGKKKRGKKLETDEKDD